VRTLTGDLDAVVYTDGLAVVDVLLGVLTETLVVEILE
jgi:hypothetical protein